MYHAKSGLKPKEEEVLTRKILIVDDDYYFRVALQKALEQSAHQATCAENAKHAQQLLLLHEYEMVITDIRMPEMNGIELLKWVKANRSMPVILMTGFSEAAETQEAESLGADGFLAKPFKKEDLLPVIDRCFAPKAIEDAAELDSDYGFCKISIDDFITGRDMKFDIFIRLREHRYIKIAHGGENMDPQRIRAYKDKNISFLYVRRDDFRKYLNFNLVLSKAVTTSKSIDHRKKLNFIKHASEMMLQNLYVNGVNQEDFVQAGALVENAVSILTDQDATFNLLEALSNHTDFLYAHSLGVSLYSTLIGKALKWHSPSTLSKLAVGGLLHDVGKKEIPREILDKPRKDMTVDEVALLETHPARGVVILDKLQCMPTDILQIVHEHHENCLGFGYPARLKKTKIHPMARIIAVANAFCNFTIKNPNAAVTLSPLDTIRRIVNLNPKYFDDLALRALCQVVSVSETELGSTRPKG